MPVPFAAARRTGVLSRTRCRKARRPDRGAVRRPCRGGLRDFRGDRGLLPRRAGFRRSRFDGTRARFQRICRRLCDAPAPCAPHKSGGVAAGRRTRRRRTRLAVQPEQSRRARVPCRCAAGYDRDVPGTRFRARSFLRGLHRRAVARRPGSAALSESGRRAFDDQTLRHAGTPVGVSRRFARLGNSHRGLSHAVVGQCAGIGGRRVCALVSGGVRLRQGGGAGRGPTVPPAARRHRGRGDIAFRLSFLSGPVGAGDGRGAQGRSDGEARMARPRRVQFR